MSHSAHSALRLPVDIAQWLIEKGVIRQQSIAGPASRTELFIDALAATTLLAGGALLVMLQRDARPFHRHRQKSALDVKPQLGLKPAAKLHNWTAIFDFVGEDAAAARRAAPFSQNDLELWLCGDWESVTVLLRHLKAALPQLASRHHHQQHHQQQQQQQQQRRVGEHASKGGNRVHSRRTNSVVADARGYVAEIDARPLYRSGDLTPQPHPGWRSGAAGGVRLNPIDGSIVAPRRGPHSSDSVTSNKFIEPPDDDARNTSQILQAAGLLLQQQQLHQHLAQQQHALHQQQQMQYFAMLGMQQQAGIANHQQLLHGLTPVGAPQFAWPGVQGAAPWVGTHALAHAQHAPHQFHGNSFDHGMHHAVGAAMPGPLGATGHFSPVQEPQYEGILHSRLAGNTPNTHAEFGTPHTASSVASVLSPSQPVRGCASISPPRDDARDELVARGESHSTDDPPVSPRSVQQQSAVRPQCDDAPVLGGAQVVTSAAADNNDDAAAAAVPREDQLQQRPSREKPKGQVAARARAALLFNPFLAQGWRKALGECLRYRTALRRQYFAMWRLCCIQRRPVSLRTGEDATPVDDEADLPTAEARPSPMQGTWRHGSPNARQNHLKMVQLTGCVSAACLRRFFDSWRMFVQDPPEAHVQKKALVIEQQKERTKRKRLLSMVLQLKSSNLLRERYFGGWRFVAADCVRRRLASLQHPEPLWLLRHNDFLANRVKKNWLRELRRKRVEQALLAQINAVEHPAAIANGAGGEVASMQKVEELFSHLQQLSSPSEGQEGPREAALDASRKCTFCGHMNVFRESLPIARHQAWCVMCGEVLEQGDELLYNFAIFSKHNVLEPTVKSALVLVQAALRWRGSLVRVRPLQYRAASAVFQAHAAPQQKFAVVVLRIVFVIRFIRRTLGRLPRVREPVAPTEDLRCTPAALDLTQPVGCKDRCEHLLHFLYLLVLKSRGNISRERESAHTRWMCAACASAGVQLVYRRLHRTQLLFGGALFAVRFIVRFRPKWLLARDVLSDGVARDRGSACHWFQRFGIVKPTGSGAIDVIDAACADGKRLAVCGRCIAGVMQPFALYWAHFLLSILLPAMTVSPPEPLSEPHASWILELASTLSATQPSTSLLSRWGALLCPSCAERGAPARLHDASRAVTSYCNRVVALQRRFAQRLMFRARAAKSAALFAKRRLGFSDADLGVGLVVAGERDIKQQVFPTLATVLPQLYPRFPEHPMWCYRCQCLISNFECRWARQRSHSAASQVKKSRHTIDRNTIVFFCRTHLHLHPCDARFPRSCASLALNYLLPKHLRHLQMLFVKVVLFISRTLGRVRARAVARRRMREALFGTGAFKDPTPKGESALPLAELCPRCQAIAPHIREVLLHADRTIGETALLPMGAVLERVFDANYWPPFLCRASAGHCGGGGERRSCYRALFAYVARFVEFRNQQAAKMVLVERRAAASICPRRPQECAEGFFHSCKRTFIPAGSAVRDMALALDADSNADPEEAREQLQQCAAANGKGLCTPCKEVIAHYVDAMCQWLKSSKTLWLLANERVPADPQGVPGV